MKNLISNFADFLLVKKGLQPITIGGYTGSARRLFKALGALSPTEEQIDAYILGMHRKGHSYSHITNTSLALEWLMLFLGKPIKLGRQKKPKTLVKDTLNEAEITKMLFNCKNIREKTILALLAYSGLRNLELCRLRVSDIDLGGNIVRVTQGKGLKDGICQITPECSRLLIHYLTHFPRLSGNFLFTTLVRNNPYHTGDLRKLVHIIAKRAKIEPEKRVYPHLLRHSLATNLINRGADVWTIKNQLRHVWIDTSMRYIHSLPYGTRSEYDRFAPSYC